MTPPEDSTRILLIFRKGSFAIFNDLIHWILLLETYISDVKVEVKGVAGVDAEVECGKEGEEERGYRMQLLHVKRVLQGEERGQTLRKLLREIFIKLTQKM